MKKDDAEKSDPENKKEADEKAKRDEKKWTETFTFENKCKITKKKDTALSAPIYPCLSDHFKKQTSEARTQLTRNSAFSSLKNMSVRCMKGSG